MLAAALVMVAVMIAGVLQGVLPVSAALRGQTNIKLAIQQVTTYADGSFPRFFQTRSGDRRTVVAVGLHNTRAEGICASGKVDSPLGPRVLRLTTRPGRQLQVADLQLALESISDVQVVAGRIALNRAAQDGDGIVTASGPPGKLPITARDLKLRIHGDVRWVTAGGLKLSGVEMTMGGDVEECF